MARFGLIVAATGSLLMLAAAAAQAAPAARLVSPALQGSEGLVIKVHGWHRRCRQGPVRFHRHVPEFGNVRCDGRWRYRRPEPYFDDPPPRRRSRRWDYDYGPPVVYDLGPPVRRRSGRRRCRALRANAREYDQRMRRDGRVTKDEARISRNMYNHVNSVCGY